MNFISSRDFMNFMDRLPSHYDAFKDPSSHNSNEKREKVVKTEGAGAEP
jgi:hypothetical protein